MGWGDGLTEDYHLRQKLLLAGYRIKYEPRAKGYGEAPLTWTQARTQRARWLRGTHDASKELRNQLLAQAIKLRKGALIDGALQAFYPSYSTLTMLSGVFLLATILANYVYQPMPDGIVWAWFGILVFLFFYPLFGLYLERAPFKAYLVMLSGPFYVFWRTWLAWTGRLGKKGITWIRTAHGERK
jgi:cellulose synthase/poly-beta-1,6-N-acetylglucosamine synthase-like glycosyltransferase